MREGRHRERRAAKLAARKKCRWIHAGLVRDVDGLVRDVWYAFIEVEKKDGTTYMQINYASNKHGKEFGNFDAGELKRDMISWDDHHQQKWDSYLTHKGTWVRGQKMAGKKHLRKSLLETWQNRHFHDPFLDGKDDRRLGPSLNAIFFTDDHSTRMSGGPRQPRSSKPGAEACYPGSNIPFSTEHIKPDAWKASPADDKPIKVVGDFLGGMMSHRTYAGHQDRLIDRIESAFWALGWRVDRHAVRQANKAMEDGAAANACRSRAWKQAPPLRIDIYKGQEVEMLMRRMGLYRSNDSSDDNSDDDNDDDNGDDNDDDGRAAPLTSKKHHKRVRSAHDNQHDNRSQGYPSPERSLSQELDEPLFVPSNRNQSPDAGPSMRLYRRLASIDEAVARFHAIGDDGSDSDAGFARDLRAGIDALDKERHCNQQDREEEDELDYLSESSPLKGKGKATKRRHATVESDDEDEFTQPKRTKFAPIRDSEIIIIGSDTEDDDDSDSDVIIDEGRSTRVPIKAEPIKNDESDSH